jgi:hypothetical protein
MRRDVDIPCWSSKFSKKIRGRIGTCLIDVSSHQRNRNNRMDELTAAASIRPTVTGEATLRHRRLSRLLQRCRVCRQVGDSAKYGHEYRSALLVRAVEAVNENVKLDFTETGRSANAGIYRIDEIAAYLRIGMSNMEIHRCLRLYSSGICT